MEAKVAKFNDVFTRLFNRENGTNNERRPVHDLTTKLKARLFRTAADLVLPRNGQDDAWPEPPVEFAPPSRAQAETAMTAVPAFAAAKPTPELEQPAEEPIDESDKPSLEPDSLPIIEEEPEPVEADTELVDERDRVQISVYRCGGCREKRYGREMKAPMINARRDIPADGEIEGAARCALCHPGEDWGWLAGVIKFAGHARQNKVAKLVGLMNAKLRGDPERSEFSRQRYLALNSQGERGEQALALFERFTHDCSSFDVFIEDEEGKQVLETARAWGQAKAEQEREEQLAAQQAEVDKRVSKIRTRISDGRFERACNTLHAAEMEFPDFHELWRKLDRELGRAQAKAFREQRINEERAAIQAAVNEGDDDALIDRLNHASKTYPEIDWDKVAEAAMDDKSVDG